MNLENVKFVDGNSYRMSWGRTVVEYKCLGDWLYEIRVFVNKVQKYDDVPAVIFPDLAGSMRCRAGFPNNGGIGIKVVCIETGEVMFEGPKKERQRVQPIKNHLHE